MRVKNLNFVVNSTDEKVYIYIPYMRYIITYKITKRKGYDCELNSYLSLQVGHNSFEAIPVPSAFVRWNTL